MKVNFIFGFVFALMISNCSVKFEINEKEFQVSKSLNYKNFIPLKSGSRSISEIDISPNYEIAIYLVGKEDITEVLYDRNNKFKALNVELLKEIENDKDFNARFLILELYSRKKIEYNYLEKIAYSGISFYEHLRFNYEYPFCSDNPSLIWVFNRGESSNDFSRSPNVWPRSEYSKKCNDKNGKLIHAMRSVSKIKNIEDATVLIKLPGGSIFEYCISCIR
ncbi:hypothetical protein JWG44_10795 [Leptospira sp. 201903071]|uniref:hypothetical protein n=1 Tax=Leptospira ainazelensis TaxID=2810034 RepID=UPI001965EE88|nr:hypothetical protein [Leptospira ainazelensis]MBM9500733.1 hypothetical protein [Leptospira ainazelensis]